MTAQQVLSLRSWLNMEFPGWKDHIKLLWRWTCFVDTALACEYQEARNIVAGYLIVIRKLNVKSLDFSK